MPLIDVRGIELFYREAGSGPPLLLIHGGAGNADVWSPVFEPLARDFRVIAYDRRAHSRSKAAPPPPAEHFPTHGDDAAALLQALGAAPAAVVGWSAGGLAALQLAADHPALVRSLVVEEPPFRVLGNLPPEVAAVFQRVEQLGGEARFREAAEVFLRWAISYRTGGTAFDGFEAELREAVVANGQTLLAELAGLGASTPAESKLQGIRCPVTCLVGELTPEVIVSGTEHLRRVLPHARVVNVPGAAHAIHFDQPEAFVAAVRSALA